MSLFNKLQNITNSAILNKNCHKALKTFITHSETSSLAHNFCAGNAYAYIAKQVEFGPRVPGSKASIQCADWIIGKLKRFGIENITEQCSQLILYNGNIFEAINISAQINPQAHKRIILFAHWDSRPWADHDSNPSNRNKAIDGANDGASGVGVILELARIFANNQSDLGIDILFVDAEDCGQRQDEPFESYNEYSWCLGIQYWINNPTLDLSKVAFAILLDMVGGKNASFPRDFFSQSAASYINDVIWQSAHQTGHSDRFHNKIGKPIIDDHVYFLINNIPAIAIIESNHPETGYFSPTWHTTGDTIENIDTKTLQAVGETLEHFLKLYV